MLGSFQDAEDALQDTLLAAWQGLGGFEGRASLRTWLFRPTLGFGRVGHTDLRGVTGRVVQEAGG